mgnify:CR=1 FL=1
MPNEPLPTWAFNDEVIYVSDNSVAVRPDDVISLKNQAQNNPRKRIRLCTHLDVSDTLHEMFIVHTKDTYVRPHKHMNKSESLHVIEGTVDLFTFDETGNIVGLTQLGDYASGRSFYHRISESLYHTLVISSDTLIFHEVTNGPLNRADTVRAPWAPDEDDVSATTEYMENLARSIDRFVYTVKK